MGRSIAPGSLSLWTHHLKDITYHKGSFKLYNSKTTIPGDAITAGAGSQMYDVYTYLDAALSSAAVASLSGSGASSPVEDIHFCHLDTVLPLIRFFR